MQNPVLLSKTLYMDLIEVTDSRTARWFLHTPNEIYRNDPVWVCPPKKMISNIFNPGTNVFFTHGEAIRWVLRKDNKNIGRVAAFINFNKAYAGDYPVGGMGFFECIDTTEAAFLLMDACRNWLEKKGMKAMEGPVNFGENDKFWGLLVEGFIHPGFGMNYNPPYYLRFFQEYGFQVYYSQVTKHLDIHAPFPERFWKIADWVRSKPEFSFRCLDVKHLDSFAADFKTVYDDAWRWHENFTPIETGSLISTFRESRHVIDPGLIWFAYQNGQPVGFLVVFPDLNQLIKPFRGNLNLINKLRLIYRFRTHRLNRARMVIFGVAPRVQRYGIEAGMIWHLNEAMKQRRWYKELEISWVGDFNPKMQALLEAVGGNKAKEHWTLRKLFDDSLPFRRSKEIPKENRQSD